jgi:outer membrane receptor protein involved in Fe transport
MKKTILFALLLFFSIYSYAQVNLTVTLSEQKSQTAMPGISVTLQNDEIGFKATQITNKQGKVFFKGLNTNGTYFASTVDGAFYDAALSGPIILRSNFDPGITLKLIKKSNSLNEVKITAYNISKINTQNAEVSSSLSAKEIRDLPVEGRDITRVLYRLPNVTLATGFFTEAPNVSINGANGLYTNYLIDGLDNNENFLGGQKFATPVGFVQEVTVLTNSFSAEYGRTANGIVNITSKSGSNDTRGEVYFLTRPGSVIDSKSPFLQRDLTGNQVKDGFKRFQEGFAIGGPIVKNKTFYFINYEQTTDVKDNLLNQPALGINTTVHGTNNFSLFSTKIDQFWTSKFHSSIRANVGFVNIQYQGGGLEGGSSFPSAGYSQDRNSVLIASKNTYVSGNFSSETDLQYSRFRWNYSHAVNPLSPDVTVLDPSGSYIASLGNPGFLFDDIENTYQLQQKFNIYKGKSHFKFGIDVLSSGFELNGGGNPNGSYTVQLNDAQLAQVKALNRGAALNIGDIPSDVKVVNYNVELRQQAFGKRQNQYAVYGEDLIAVTPRLNITLGLRYDYDDLSKGGASSGDYNNIAPRTSFNYKLTDKSVIRGGFGLFYDKILYTIYSDALQNNTTSTAYKQELQQLINKGILPANTNIDRVTFNGNLTAGFPNPSFGYLQGPSSSSLQSQRDNTPSNELRILNPNGYQNPMSYQYSLGYQYQIGQNTLFYVDLMHSNTRHLPRLINLNAPSAYSVLENNGQPRSPAAADATRPVPNGIARSVTITDMGGKSAYNSASFNLIKGKGDDKYAYRLIYTLSRLNNNTEDVNFRAADANNFNNEYGPSINDRTHVINAIYYYYPWKNLAVSAALLIQSGQPINRIPDATKFGGTTDLNGDGSSYGDAYDGNSDRYPGASRNSDRLPWSKNVDLAASYTFKVNKKQRLELSSNIYNVFNTVNLSGYANNATQSNQIQIGPPGGPIVKKNAGPPRQFQFGVAYLF